MQTSLVVSAVSFTVALFSLAACSQAEITSSSRDAPVSSPASPTEERVSSALASTVWKAVDVENIEMDGGDLRVYFEGDTHAARQLATGVAELKAGQELHPPHTHADEEFLLVTEGSGVWTLGDEDFPATAGDLLYAAPWENHGIRANPETPLKFYFIKYHGKGAPDAPEPADEASE